MNQDIRDGRPPGPDAAEDERWMALALAEAAHGLGRTSPNPPVGCVIVDPRKGEVVGRGFHPGAGQPHAEVFALREAGERARGATAYVTLEPCSHFGRTPPCADALIEAGVARVVAAAGDPNPLVSGRGLERLRAAGVQVELGVLQAQARRQQAGFRFCMTRGRPHVIYKYAMTLDGKVAAAGEANGPVSSPEARAQVMRWRSECDAIAVGLGTVLTDDPQLTARGVPGVRQPRPVVFDHLGRTPPQARLFDRGAGEPGPVIVTGPGVIAPALEAAGAVLVPAETLLSALRALAELGLQTVFLEGGPTLASDFAAQDLIDEVRVFVAPKLLGAGLAPLSGPVQAMGAATPFVPYCTEWAGSDLLICAERSASAPLAGTSPAVASTALDASTGPAASTP